MVWRSAADAGRPGHQWPSKIECVLGTVRPQTHHEIEDSLAKLAASWEGFVIEQVLATEPFDEAWFWATHQGAEIDLLLRRRDRLLGVQCKRPGGRSSTMNR
jgi:predicted AAA+ superfamily ATPase